MINFISIIQTSEVQTQRHLRLGQLLLKMEIAFGIEMDLGLQSRSMVMIEAGLF
jgi:hypothetical protein